MIITIYAIVLAYFLLGFICFFFINSKKEIDRVHESWMKTIIYFLIFNLVFFSIVVKPVVFRFLSVIIVIEGFYELLRLFIKSGYKQKCFFILSILYYCVLSAGFLYFSMMNDWHLVLYSFMIVSAFDSFSQITGELLGKRKILPRISPGKTVEGFIGGTVVAVASAFLLNSLNHPDFRETFFLGAGLALFGFIGDASASLYKRKYGVKDFINIIPWHGGFLDRFDSFIAGGFWITIYGFLNL
ncbi:MAG TPA: phosphatidate cytidylyltransferase [Bacteroidales bacterium]|nr:phosphatidate cytidylyltransferase [Bacteroidales bacterium]